MIAFEVFRPGGTLPFVSSASSRSISRVVVGALVSLAANGIASATQLPLDVSRFIEMRESCDHWRGEFGYDEERQADINWAICQSCVGTDAELARLKRKYMKSREVQDALGQFDPHIEPKDKAEQQRFCKATRKPMWEKSDAKGVSRWLAHRLDAISTTQG